MEALFRKKTPDLTVLKSKNALLQRHVNGSFISKKNYFSGAYWVLQPYQKVVKKLGCFWPH